MISSKFFCDFFFVGVRNGHSVSNLVSDFCVVGFMVDVEFELKKVSSIIFSPDKILVFIGIYTVTYLSVFKILSSF